MLRGRTVLLLLVLWAYLCSHGDGLRALRRTTGGRRGGAGVGLTLMGQDANGVPLRRSKRGWMWNQFFLLEEYTGMDHQYVGKLHSDGDRGDGSIRYVLTGDGAGSLFIIDENSGDIHATKRLDREEKAYYTLRAKAVNRITNTSLEGESEFIIKIHDINDNEPKFTKDPYFTEVPEMSPLGTVVMQVTATDADDPTYGNSARVVYSILQGQPYFSVEPNTGVIKTALPNMDRETKENYVVVIQAKDMAGQMGGLSGTTTVSITLSDVNDNPPRFPKSLYEFKAPESTEPGSTVAVLRAMDADIGRNAEMNYRITSSDGPSMFDISTNRSTQDGVITLRKSLDFERKRSYTLRIQVENSNPDPRFLRYAATTDGATVKLIVEDVDEPPVFDRVGYVMEVKEDVAVGTIIGSVSATDPDSRSLYLFVMCRYSIDRRTDMDRVLNVHPGNGSVFMLRTLDREDIAWHNVSVIATEFNNPRLMSRVPVYVRVLDVNDNAPTFATYYETFVCENAKANQRIQTVSAADADEPIGGHRFFFSLAHEASVKANFTVRDNKDNTAGILTRRNSYSRLQRSNYLVPVVISDSDFPMQSSTNTLTVHVCTCDREGNMQLCNQEALVLTAGLSTGALMAIIFCVLILLMIVVLFAALRRQQRKKEPLIISKEDVRDNVVSYNDEGGGEEDTQAFDIGTLRNPEATEESKQRRDIKPETLHPPIRRTVILPPAHRDNADVRNFINQRLQENDQDPTAPPYDSLATYAYEGSGSVAESLSSLGSMTIEGDQDYNYLSEWGPRFKKLADLYGGEDSDSY
uniref:Cadherin-10 n=1 Tax=Oncorhynchus kisutch TaxID=8019 RepID=A0A8C7KSS8_ONCKI